MTPILATLIALAQPVHAEIQRACVAMTVLGEARGEPVRGQHLVASVIRNRMASKQWPDTVCGVVLQPHQFHGALAWLHAKRIRLGEITQSFAAADSRDASPCARATYFTRTEEHPAWARDMRTLCVVGHHKFMIVVGTASGNGAADKPASVRNNTGNVRRRQPRRGDDHRHRSPRRAHVSIRGK